MKQDDIGKFILQLRTDKGWTQEELANMIPITRQAVSRWEQGKSIPDSSTLVILSEIFDVSINELLSGKRIPKKEIIKESEKIALEIVDKHILMKKKIKRILISFISLFFIGIVGFLCYYFFATYNSVKVYSIGGKSKNFYLQEGVMIVTKQKLFFKLGNLIHSDDIEVDKVTLSFKKDGKDKLLYDNHDLDRLIIENYGYEEYFYFDDLEDILKGIRMDIYYDDKVESIDLVLFLSLSNNKFTFNKIDLVGKNISEKDNELHNNILKFMIKNGTYEENYYIYKIDNKVFKYCDKHEQFWLERNENERWILTFENYDLTYDFILEENVIFKNISCSNIKCNKEDKNLYNKFYNYLDKYILGKSN